MRLHAGAVGFAEGVSADDQGDGFFVVHGHALEGASDVLGRGERIRLAAGPFRIDVDQAHVVGAELLVELARVVVALVREPFFFLTPIGLVGFPAVGASKRESEGLETHRLERAVAGEDQQVGPGERLSVLLLDRPEQAAGLVEIGVVGPAVERGEALLSCAAAAATVADPVGAGSVPGHANEERAVVPVVGRPPVLRGSHHGFDIGAQGLDVEVIDGVGVAEIAVHGIGSGGVASQRLEADLIGPPVLVRGHVIGPFEARGSAGRRAIGMSSKAVEFGQLSVSPHPTRLS